MSSIILSQLTDISFKDEIEKEEETKKTDTTPQEH
jgi:hypothetical protein